MDDIGRYLANMKSYEFWKLVRKHRPWLTRDEAAAYLKKTKRGMEDWATLGKGPTPVSKGKFIRYHLDVVDVWMATTIQPKNRAD